MQRAQMLLAAGVLLLAGLSGAWFAGRPPAPPPVEIERDRSPVDQPAMITVHVSGPVERPGLVQVPQGSRVGDALAAAGGASRAADLGSLNLAAPLADGQQVVVPVRGSGEGGHGSQTSDGRVHLNTAGAAQLEELPGVGPVLAGRILAYREEHGPFQSVEDLLDVPGIGEGKLASLRDLVVVP